MPNKSHTCFQQQIGAQQRTVEIDNKRNCRICNMNRHKRSSLNIGYSNKNKNKNKNKIRSGKEQRS